MDLHLDLDEAPGSSLRIRLEYALREAVRSGRLAPGARLPATRALCRQLGVSRGVVVEAYAQLAAEGYLDTRRGAGTTVAATVESRQPQAQPELQPAPRYDMNPYRPALGGFPRGAWSAALTRALRETPDERLGYPDPAGAPELRAALASYLGRVRGVRASGQHVVITPGLHAGLDLLWHLLAETGARKVALEHPGWVGMYETANAAGLRIEQLALDGEGVVVERINEQHVDAVALVPAHQYPTGVVLSAARRAALIAWARTQDKLIIEDDYDAQYRYDRQPIGSLQGVAPDYVIYGGSASKILAPVIRLGWLILPKRLAPLLAALQYRRGMLPSTIDQLALADLIQSGQLDRHLRRQRQRYERQRAALLAAIAAELPGAHVTGAAAGLFAVLHLPPDVDEHAVLASARSRGIALRGLQGAAPALVLGYANLPATTMPSAIRALAASIKDAVRTSSP